MSDLTPEEQHLVGLLDQWMNAYGPEGTLNKLNLMLQKFTLEGDEQAQHNVLVIISALKEELEEKVN